jgi:hypothetical protein
MESMRTDVEHGAMMGNTLGKHIDRGERIAAYCYAEGCHHSAWLDLPAIAEKLGRDHSVMHRKLPLRCTKCGSRNVSLRLHGADTDLHERRARS